MSGEMKMKVVGLFLRKEFMVFSLIKTLACSSLMALVIGFSSISMADDDSESENLTQSETYYNSYEQRLTEAWESELYDDDLDGKADRQVIQMKPINIYDSEENEMGLE